VAALAAETKPYPTVAGESGGKLKPQRASRPQLPDAGSICFTSMRPMYGTRKSDDVLAGQHVTGDKDRRMMWLEVKNGRAYVMVDKARYNDWKKNTL
jgi:hypothetical protein